MKTLVIYKSKTGSAKTYAQWIAEDLQADLLESSQVNADTMAPYDTVIYGGGLYAVGINGIKLIKDNLGKLKDKRLIVFATGATPPREDDINAVRDKNFTTEQLRSIRFFYLRGGFDYSKLNLVDKLLMNLLKLKIKSKAGKDQRLTPDERGMLAAYDKPLDFKRRQYIEELVRYART